MTDSYVEFGMGFYNKKNLPGKTQENLNEIQILSNNKVSVLIH